MANDCSHEQHEKRVGRLIAQDSEINPKHMQEVRMQLEQALAASESKARQTRWRILVAFAVYLLAVFGYAFYLSNWGDATPKAAANLTRQLIMAPVMFSGLLALVLGVLLLLLYLFKYGPRLGRARFELQNAMLLELQGQVRELQETIERRKND